MPSRPFLPFERFMLEATKTYREKSFEGRAMVVLLKKIPAVGLSPIS